MHEVQVLKSHRKGGFCVAAQQSRSVAAVLAATGAGLMHADAGKLGQQRFEFLPDPLRQVLAGRVFQAGNVVQVVVVETLIDRLEDRLDLGKVANPASMRIDLALDVDGCTEGVAVQATTLVTRWDVGQEVGGFEGEFFEQFQGKRSAG